MLSLLDRPLHLQLLPLPLWHYNLLRSNRCPRLFHPPPDAPASLSPEILTNHPFLPRPQVIRNAPALPPLPDMIDLIHPANNRIFLSLPAYDHLPHPQLLFGLHHETVATACMIIAYNRPGYLSKSRKRNSGRVDIALNPFLHPGSYYYHLDSETEEPYSICRDFRQRSFPHNKVPHSWSAVPSAENWDWPSSSSLVSQKVKDRDNVCLVTGSMEYVTTSHVVPKDEDTWVCRILQF